MLAKSKATAGIFDQNASSSKQGVRGNAGHRERWRRNGELCGRVDDNDADGSAQLLLIIFIQLLLLLHRRAIHQHSTPRREDAMREGDTQARRRRRNRIVDLKHLGVCTVASKKI